ncbi:MAG: hypothetical protein P4L92_04775 [Rudaea sp.]|nr:hypothetical protein [Rudaea sp.]
MRRIAIEDEGLHQAGPEPHWQESVAFGWRDARSGVGGFHRIGNEANLSTANMWCGVFADNGDQFRWNAEDQPLLRPHSHGLNCAGQSLFHDGRDLRFQLRETGAEVDLVIEDIGLDPNKFAAGNVLDTKIYTNHFNSNCRVRGTATLNGQRYAVDGLGWRDHSWGPRIWASFPVNRVLLANFGEDLAITALMQVWVDGTVTKKGHIARNGRKDDFADFESLALIEDDGISARGCEFNAALATGERISFRMDLVGGVICKTKQRVGFDGVGECWLGDRSGFGLFELNTNARLGTSLPPYALHCGLNNGPGKRSARLGTVPFAETLARAGL